MKARCRHCLRFRPVYARALCSACYQRLEIRALYPVDSARGQKCPTPNFSGEAKVAKRPTSKLPGTPEKQRVMSARLMRGEALRHPDDAVADAERTGGQQRGICRLLVALGVGF